MSRQSIECSRGGDSHGLASPDMGHSLRLGSAPGSSLLNKNQRELLSSVFYWLADEIFPTDHSVTYGPTIKISSLKNSSLRQRKVFFYSTETSIYFHRVITVYARLAFIIYFVLEQLRESNKLQCRDHSSITFLIKVFVFFPF